MVLPLRAGNAYHPVELCDDDGDGDAGDDYDARQTIETVSVTGGWQINGRMERWDVSSSSSFVVGGGDRRRRLFGHTRMARPVRTADFYIRAGVLFECRAAECVIREDQDLHFQSTRCIIFSIDFSPPLSTRRRRRLILEISPPPPPPTSTGARNSPPPPPPWKRQKTRTAEDRTDSRRGRNRYLTIVYGVCVLPNFSVFFFDAFTGVQKRHSNDDDDGFLVRKRTRDGFSKTNPRTSDFHTVTVR